MNLQPWRPSGLVSPTRTCGEVCLRINGGFLDIWLRVNGVPRWFSVDAAAVLSFLKAAKHAEEIVLRAESDWNSEEGWQWVPGHWEPVKP